MSRLPEVRPEAQPAAGEIRTEERTQEDEEGRVWRVYAAVDVNGELLAAVRFPEALVDRGNNGICGGFMIYLVKELQRKRRQHG